MKLLKRFKFHRLIAPALAGLLFMPIGVLALSGVISPDYFLWTLPMYAAIALIPDVFVSLIEDDFSLFYPKEDTEKDEESTPLDTALKVVAEHNAASSSDYTALFGASETEEVVAETKVQMNGTA